MMKLIDHPMVSDEDADSSYLWNFTVNLRMNGKITRISSRNHRVEYTQSDS